MGAVRCITVLRRVIGPIGGAWIPYTAAQVAARRAAQWVPRIVCFAVVAGSPGTAQAPRDCNCAPPPIPTATLLIPRMEPLPHLLPRPVAVSEPGALVAFSVALASLWLVRRARS